MKALILFFILISMMSKTTLAQDSLKVATCVFSRALIEDSTFSPLQNAHVFNLTSSTGTLSNERGVFNLKVKIKDSVLISILGYKKHFKIISEAECISQNDSIILVKDTILLSEIQIYPFRNWEEFKKDFVELNLEGTVYKKIIIEGITQYDGPYIPQKPNLINNPVSYLYSRYNKLGRINHKLEKIRIERQKKFSN